MTPNNFVDLTGQSFGRLTVIRKGNGRYTKGGQYKTTWICKCACGNEKEIDAQKLKKGKTVSCGCYMKEVTGSINFNDITGNKYGRLTVVRFLKQEEREDFRRAWLCRCECGNLIQVNASKLKNGHTKSCGCIVKEHIGNVNRKYDIVCKRLYGVYKAMLDRCYNENSREYKNYGGRGIVVCEEWLGEKGYDAFAKWAFENGYNQEAKHGECTLDRENVDKGYNPNNCRWITNLKQQNNRRDCRMYEYNGRIQTIAEWSREFKVSYSVLRKWLVYDQKSIKEFVMGYTPRR